MRHHGGDVHMNVLGGARDQSPQAKAKNGNTSPSPFKIVEDFHCSRKQQFWLLKLGGLHVPDF